MAYKLLALSGSSRKGSYNMSLLNAFKTLAPEGVTVEIADISALPMYNQDLEAEFPAAVLALKEKIKAADAILVATPEHNRSVSAMLKSAIDWTSRPYGTSAWFDKIVYTMGATPSPLGTALAQVELRKILLYQHALVIGQPEFYVSSAHEKFAEDGTLTDETTKGFIANAFTTITGLVDKVR